MQPVIGPALWHLANNICGAQLPGHSAATTFYYGRDSDCTYIEGTRSASNLISPTILIPADLRPALVSFNYLLQVEGGSFDTTNIDVSTNGGTSWTQVGTKANLINNGQWHNVVLDITGAIGTANAIRVRFRFDTLDSIINSTIGWHIDDVQVCSQAVDISHRG